MKALTVLQPYAHLIMLPDTDPRRKRVENRTWRTDYRGRIYIHAGKGRGLLSDDQRRNYEIPLEAMAFGAVVGVATLRHCAAWADIQDGKYDRSMPWLRQHQHAFGPWCWILEDVQPMERPIPYKGAQGLFDIKVEELAAAIG